VTMTNVSLSVKGGRRATKFTPQAIEKIKKLVAQGDSREAIASVIDVTVGSLQVTCSKLGISLRRTNGKARHTLNGNGSSIRTPLLEMLQTTVHTAPLAEFAITMRHRDREVTADIPLTAHAIEALALERALRDLGIGKLVGQILVAAIKKGMIREILCDEVPPSGA
jgi:hypothetical protein